MIISEISGIDYLDTIKKICVDKNFKFLFMGVLRFGDNQKYYKVLELYWNSIDNLTSDKIVFLNFCDQSQFQLNNAYYI